MTTFNPKDTAMQPYAALAAVTLALSLPLPAIAQTAAPEVKTLDVYVDLPTGFTFVKMPAGWKFVGKLEADQMRELPGTVHTTLLPPDEERQYAHPAANARIKG
jgi:hypothetical protein